MHRRSVVWCSHPVHDDLSADGKKRYWKTGPKPSHPKGKRIISMELSTFINEHHQGILSGTSQRLMEGDYLCSSCFKHEENRFVEHEKLRMDSFNISRCNICDNDDTTVDNILTSPMDDDHVNIEQRFAKMRLNQVFEQTDVQIIDDIRNSYQIEKKVEEVYFKLKEWSHILSSYSSENQELLALSSLDLSIDEAVAILVNLRKVFDDSNQQEQEKLLTMLPSTWGRERTAKWFGSSKHQARKSIALKVYSDTASFSEDRRGNKPLDDQTVAMIQQFYTSDDVSRETSNKKQVVRPPPSRDPVALRFLHLTVGETFEKFKTLHPDIKIGRSKFFSLKPSWVRDRTPHKNCLCIQHANADLLLQAVRNSLQSHVAMDELVQESVCKSPSEKCYYRSCIDCKNIQASFILTDGFDFELEESATWSVWKKMGPRYELLHIDGPLRVLLNEIDAIWPSFITHQFYTRKQRDYISLIKEKSSLITYAIVQMDFAQNFAFFAQNEIQSAYYSRRQAALYTVYIKVGEEQRNMVIISDYMPHDTKFVYCAQKLVVEFLVKEYPNIFKINYVSDGATGHFKNKYNICNLAYHFADFGIHASWTFSASGHGKGPCDGLGAVVKSTATRYLLKGGPQVSFSTHMDFYKWCAAKNDKMVIKRPRQTDNSNSNPNYIPEPNRPIEIRWLSINTIQIEFENVLKARWDRLSAKDSLSGIRELHQFDSDIHGLVSCRRVSESDTTTTHKFTLKLTVQSTVSRLLTSSESKNFGNHYYIIIQDNNDFRLAEVHSSDHDVLLLNVSCFDPPIPALRFKSSKLPHLSNLIIPAKQFRARFIKNPEQLANDEIKITSQQLMEIEEILQEV